MQALLSKISFADHKRSYCPALGLNRIVHNPQKYSDGFTVIKDGERYRRLKAICDYVKVRDTQIQVPQYSIVYNGNPFILPAFKRVMIRNNKWITSDEEFSKVLENQLWKNHHYEEEEVKALEASLAAINLKESKPPTATSIAPEEEEKNSEIKEFDVYPQEHSERQIKERNIIKTKRIATNDDDKPVTQSPRKLKKEAPEGREDPNIACLNVNSLFNKV
jgi:hypothetical protein